MSDFRYLLSHPPRCIEGLQATALEAGLPDVQFDGHGEEWNPVFALSCSCGASEFQLKGYHLVEPEYSLFLSPLEAVRTSCQTTTLLLDTDLHGYDAELGHGSGTRRAEGKESVFRCLDCSAERGSLFMRFEFTQDLFDGSFDDVQVQKEDLFTWVSCVSRCSSCGKQNLVSDFECA